MAAVEIVAFLLCLSVIVAIFYGPWQRLRVDWARHRMFAVRDALFDAAHAGELDFESRSYKEARSSIERMIRFSHLMTWQRMALYYILLRDSLDERNTELSEVGADEHPLYSQARIYIGRSVLLCIMTRSIILLPVYLVVICAQYVNLDLVKLAYRIAQGESRRREEVGYPRGHRWLPT